MNALFGVVRRFFGPLLLLVTAALWGTAFVAQKTAGEHLGPFGVLLCRGILAAIFLRVWMCFTKGTGFTRVAFWGGALSGAGLFVACLAQQIGIADTTPGISAFLTTNYILFVPILGLFLGRRASWLAWIGVAVALVGSFFICIAPGATSPFAIGRGEAWTLLCAILFAAQIMIVDRFAPGTDVLAFSCSSQVACFVLAVPFVLLMPTERACFAPANLATALGSILYLGIVSSGIAYTLQNFGQVRTPPTIAAVLMSMEAVFGALAGYLFRGDVLTPRQFLGCVLVFAAAVTTSVLSSLKREGAKA